MLCCLASSRAMCNVIQWCLVSCHRIAHGIKRDTTPHRRRDDTTCASAHGTAAPHVVCCFVWYDSACCVVLPRLAVWCVMRCCRRASSCLRYKTKRSNVSRCRRDTAPHHVAHEIRQGQDGTTDHSHATARSFTRHRGMRRDTAPHQIPCHIAPRPRVDRDCVSWRHTKQAQIVSECFVITIPCHTHGWCRGAVSFWCSISLSFPVVVS